MLSRARLRLWKMFSELSVKSLSDERSLKLECSSTMESCKKEAEMYEKAIATLNTLQLPQSERGQKEATTKLQSTALTQADRFAEIRDLPSADLDKLSAIHVAGTKGKGSVCAFCESILRSSGFKTGFYSSPHLLEVRERMRVNGEAISKKLFTHYFWECWNTFEMEQKRYATFLVFMSFHVFLKEKVDVAIVEVGCGGEYDSTNVLRRPAVCGVTMLDKDHLHFLGGTVESIAWHKAGIFKPGVPAFTVPQDATSMRVLKERSKERQTSLKIVPNLPKNEDGKFPVLGIEGKHQYQNASLAVYLCRTWLERRNNAEKFPLNEVMSTAKTDDQLSLYADEFSLPETFKQGLEKAFWPGRTQRVEREGFTFYLDGAHTRKSIEACTEWFCEKSKDERLQKSDKTMAKILMFNFKGDRNARSLVEPLVKCDFDYVVFCPNILNDAPVSTTSDTTNFCQDIETDKKKCYANQDVWREVLSNMSSDSGTSNLNSRVFPCVFDAFHWVVADVNASSEPVTSLRDVISCADHVQVFVTGSLYLVGMVLSLLKETGSVSQ